MIQEFSPDADIIPITLAIQKDREHCAYFSLDFMDWWLKFPDAVKTILKMPHQTKATTTSSEWVLTKAAKLKDRGRTNFFTILRETLLQQAGFGSLFTHVTQPLSSTVILLASFD